MLHEHRVVAQVAEHLPRALREQLDREHRGQADAHEPAAARMAGRAHEREDQGDEPGLAGGDAGR